MNSPEINQISKEILDLISWNENNKNEALEKYLWDLFAVGRIVGGDVSLATIDVEVEKNPSGLTIGQNCFVILPK